MIKGYQVAQVVKEIASGVNENRPKWWSLLKDSSITLLVVEHQDRLTRFGFRSIETLLELQGRKFEVMNAAENDKEDLLHDLARIVYSIHARQNAAQTRQTQTERLVEQLQAKDDDHAVS